MKKQVIFFLFACLSGAGFGQNIGVNRAGIRWHQINTPVSRIIYPTGLDSAAGRIATLTELLGKDYRGTIGPSLKKVDVILQAENTLSNAYVGLGPYRSEFYLTPPQNPFQLGANNWADQLAIHEFRHVQQFSNFNTGLSKLGSVLGGQYGRAVANSLAVPDWFWEGDAVWNETIHTQQGRGRLPFFFNGYKSLALEQRDYSWMKLRNGSFKNFVPNHYNLGYLLVAYGRETYGDSIWMSITKDAAGFKGLFYPMQKAVKKYTGKDYKTFTSEALASFRGKWQSEKVNELNFITPAESNNVINYQFPYPTVDGGWVALKTGYKQIPVFVKKLESGREIELGVKDIGYDDYFSYKNGRLVYSAYEPDPRWDNREYSVIKLLDIVENVQRTITKHSRYFSPDISFDGNKIVAVEVNPGQVSEVHVLDNTGRILKRFSADSTLFFSHPKWLADSESILIAGRKSDGNMGWLIWKPSDNTSKWVLPPAQRLVGFPVVKEDTVFYTSSSGGLDALHYLVISKGEDHYLRSFPTGIYQGFSNGNQIIGSVFTSDGYRLASWPNAPEETKGRFSTVGLTPLYINNSFAGYRNFDSVSTKQYQVEKYRKSTKLINFHSWIPEPNDPDYRFTLVGENVLSTLSTELYYNYNTNERSSEAGLRLLYGNSYLMPFLNASQTWNRRVRLNADTILNYHESELAAGLLLPLNFSGGKYSRRLTLQSSVNYDKTNWQGIAKQLFANQDFLSLQNRLTYVSQSQRALQHIYPRFAQTLILDYKTMVNDKTANQFLASGAIYFPGLRSTHNLVITAAFQGRDTMLQYLYSNSFPFSRGYNSLNYPRMWRVGINYHFPLWYPDWGFANLAYIRRIRANAFYDYTQGKSLRTGSTTPFGTVGGELFLDMKFWNIQTASFGFRYSYLINTDLLNRGRVGLFEFVLPVNLFGR